MSEGDLIRLRDDHVHLDSRNPTLLVVEVHDYGIGHLYVLDPDLGLRRLLRTHVRRLYEVVHCG